MLKLASRTADEREGPDRSPPPTSFNEAARVAALHGYGILDSPRERAFDDITRIAAIVCGTPMAAINLVDSGRQWFKSEVGLGTTAFPLETSICAHAIVDGNLFVVPDLQRDPRFSNNPLVMAQPNLRFYAGAPLQTRDGHVLGMVCVLDLQPRHLTSLQEDVLRALAHQVMTLLDLRRRLRRTEQLLVESGIANLSLETLGATFEAADAAKDEMLGLISHELLTPLMIIDGNVRLCRRTTDEAERTRALDEVSVSSRRMARLIGNMMVLARDDHGEMIAREPLLLRHCLAAALAEHERLHPGSPVVLETDEELPPVVGDQTSIDQVLTNLLSNAGKYGNPNEPITLTALRDGNFVRVTVANGGEALDPGNIDRLFVPFFREGARQRKMPGIGLGLAVCRRLIRAHGGKIWATARPGGGLEVSFTLPIEEAE